MALPVGQPHHCAPTSLRNGAQWHPLSLRI
jgi:hypothetical protein